MTTSQATTIGMWWRLTLLGGIGAASMGLVDFSRFGEAPIDPVLLRALAMLQPTVLVALCAALGLWATPRVGLDSPAVRAAAQHRPIWPALRPQFASAALGGLATAVILVGFGVLVRSRPEAAPVSAFELPLVTKLLYGGIVEELLLRWGLMSLFVWIAWRAGGSARPVPAWAIWAGLVASSLLFAAGHLPALHVLLPDPSGTLLGLVLAANFIPGIVFGWLFWKRGLEAAMIAHGFAHLLGTAALAVLA